MLNKDIQKKSEQLEQIGALLTHLGKITKYRKSNKIDYYHDVDMQLDLAASAIDNLKNERRATK
jgi:hypothetical protein